MSEEGNNHEEVLRRAAENTELSLALRRACQAALRSDLAVRTAHDWLALDARVSALRQALDEASNKIKAAEAERDYLVRRNLTLVEVRTELCYRMGHIVPGNVHLEALLKIIDKGGRRGENNFKATEAEREHLVSGNQLLLRVKREIDWRIEIGLNSNGHLEAIKKFIDLNLAPTEGKP